MNWYLLIKFLHIIAVAITIGGMFARQLVRSIARQNESINVVTTLTNVAERIDRILVIPSSSMMVLLGIILAILQKWPIFGFLQGASQNWLLVSNLLLIVMMALIPAIFIPHNNKVVTLLQPALEEGHLTPELVEAMNARSNRIAHCAEEIIVLVVAALMVLKPF